VCISWTANACLLCVLVQKVRHNVLVLLTSACMLVIVSTCWKPYFL